MNRTKIIDYLKQLDLSDIEAKLYLTLLEIGPTSVRDLAETIDIKRTTTYLYIDQLVEKGLIVKIVKGSQKQIAANNPDSLLSLVERKVTKAKQAQEKFPEILKLIQTSLPHTKDISDAEIIYYKGKNGVKKIYEDALQAGELRSYANLSDVEGIFPENLVSFNKAFEKNKELTIYEIIENSAASRKQVELLSQNKRYNFKYLPKDVEITSADILIYDGKVGIINVGEKISGIILRNTEYYNISKELFNFIWKTLPKLKQ